MDKKEIIKKLLQYKLFDGLSGDEIAHILTCSEEQYYKKGKAVFHESNLSLEFYILLNGRVSIRLEPSLYENQESESDELAFLEQGDIFGEMGFLRGDRRSAYVLALEDIRVLRVDGLKLYELFDKYHRIGYNIMRNIAMILAHRLAHINLKWRNEKGSPNPLIMSS